MSRNFDRDSLLRDVLSDGSPSGARESWLVESMRLSRQRRIQNRTRDAGVILAVVAALAFITLRFASNHRPETVSMPSGLLLVSTQPLASNALVATRPLSAGHFVSSAGNATITRTTKSEFRTISDSELLAFVFPRPAILVRADHGSEKLVFSNPEDQGTLYSDHL